MNNKENLSIEISRLLEHTAVQAFEMYPVDIIKLFDNVEANCLKKYTSKEEILEIKRRITEWKMKLTADINSPFELVDDLHKKMLSLGYSSLENECNTEIYFAQYCIRNKKTDTARTLLIQLCIKLNDSLAIEELEVYKYFKSISEKMLSQT